MDQTYFPSSYLGTRVLKNVEIRNKCDELIKKKN